MDHIEKMTSLQIAETSHRRHKDVLSAIRKMETAWIKVTGRNFSLTSYKDSTGRTLPSYELTKEETLFVATKFNDEARARLILRWEELELKEKNLPNTQVKEVVPMTSLQALQATINHMVEIEQRQIENSQKIQLVEQRLDAIDKEREENSKLLLSETLSEKDIPEMTMRAKINKLAREYGNATNTPMADVWHKIYGDLYYLYHIKLDGNNKLETAEKRNCLEPIYNIVSGLIRRLTH